MWPHCHIQTTIIVAAAAYVEIPMGAPDCGLATNRVDAVVLEIRRMPDEGRRSIGDSAMRDPLGRVVATGRRRRHRPWLQDDRSGPDPEPRRGPCDVRPTRSCVFERHRRRAVSFRACRCRVTERGRSSCPVRRRSCRHRGPQHTNLRMSCHRYRPVGSQQTTDRRVRRQKRKGLVSPKAILGADRSLGRVSGYTDTRRLG